jgi:CRISPR-associated endonuclease/helicase Cas3
VELFFEGFDTDVAEVSFIWRSNRPLGVRLLPPVTEGEAVDVPIGEVRAVLQGRRVLRLADDKASLEEVSAGELRPGDVIVLAPEDGLYDQHGWDPKSSETVLDVSPLTSGALLLDAGVLENLAPGSGEHVAPLLKALTATPDDTGPGAEEQDEAGLLDELVETLRAFAPHPWLGEAEWSEFLDGLSRKLTRPVGPGVDKVPRVEPAERARGQEKVDVRSEAFEELSFTTSSQLLRDHLRAVGETAALLASRLGLPALLVGSVRLAGEWHDLGKHDPRFQRWMSPDGPAVEPLAKSGQPRALWESSRALSGWPKGGRHELLSARLAASWLPGHPLDWDSDLVLHLVASHHGEGRPFVKVVGDIAPSSVVAPLEGERACVSGDLALPDWDQPRRFRSVCERYGLWGVALLEAILRQADHAVSQLTGVA